MMSKLRPIDRLKNISIGIFIVYERVGSLVYNFLCRSRDKMFSLHKNTQVKNKPYRPNDIEDSIMDDEELNEIPASSFHHQVTKYEEDFMEENYQEEIVYNKDYNQVMIKSFGNKIYIICKESKEQQVIKRMSTPTCILSEYKEWSSERGMEKRSLLVFQVMDEIDEMEGNTDLWDLKN